MATIPIIELRTTDSGEKFYPLTHVKAVIGLEDSSFFTLDENGNVTLKSGYQNFWVPGWLAAGGVGTGGGGGGLINTVYGVSDLGTKYGGTEDLTATFSAKAIDTIWHGLQELSSDTYTKAQVNALIDAVNGFQYEVVATLPTAGLSTMYKIYLIPSSDPQTQNIKDEYITIYDGSTYKWEQIGSTAIDLSGYATEAWVNQQGFATKVSGATSGNFAALDANGNLTDSGHKHGDYVTALGTSGNYLTWTKNGTTNNITVPFATNATTATKLGSSTVGSTTKPIYLSNGTPTVVSYLDTSLLLEPARAPYTLTSMPLVNTMAGNKLALLSADQIIIETTTDGGTTWVDAGISDSLKRRMFVGTYDNPQINIPLIDGKRNKLCGLRITITGMKYNVPEGTSETSKYTYWNSSYVSSTERYCTLTGVYLWVTSRNDYIRTRVYCAKGSDPNNWSYVDSGANVYMNGNSGGNFVRLAGVTFGGGTTQTNNNWNYRFEFFTDGNNGGDLATTSNTTTQIIYRIQGFGQSIWTIPNNIAGINHLYTWDVEQCATFPASIYTNKDGSYLGTSTKRWNIYGRTATIDRINVTGSSSATTTSSGINIVYGDNNAHIGMSTLLGIYSSGNIVIRPNGATSSADGNGSLEISSNGIVAKEAITAERLVSSGYLYLTGSTNATRRIYFGDSSHYLELDEYGFHFSHGVYSDDFVSAGGIGSSSGSGGALADLADVSLSSGLANGDLLKYDGTHWVNIPQSQIVPTVSVSFDDLTSHPTTLSGYGITDAKIQGGTITLGSNSITPLTSVPDLSSTYLSLANGGTVQGQVTFGEYIHGPSNIWSIGDDGVADFHSLTVNGASVLTSHQTVTNAGATLTPGQTITVATIGSTSITVQVPFFAMQQDIGTLNSYFTNGSANNALKLENHAASYFATATSVTDLTTRVTSLESMFEIVDGNVHVKNSMGLWSDSFVSAGGVGTSGGGSGYGVEDITSREDGTIDFTFTGGDIITVDLNHTHEGLLPDVTSTDNGKIVKVVNGEWALAAESGGGSTVAWGASANGKAILTVNGDSRTVLLESWSELPSVSASDNGKVLQVSSGAWAAVTPASVPTFYTGTSDPASSLGNDGDVYLKIAS